MDTYTIKRYHSLKLWNIIAIILRPQSNLKFKYDCQETVRIIYKDLSCYYGDDEYKKNKYGQFYEDIEMDRGEYRALTHAFTTYQRNNTRNQTTQSQN